ncbi:MotA/TolQ/ExbB proton channel family protein [Tautonia sociabilis]|uniref:MotA/TolQ/ExbB proton channel family protein n=2 Tax=Tautonia sociabilis TaxID=2080755 RepID=A0A432MLA0_9BACT|nr:MotA/TolQ/ExbB proton channel family protein [Tautonia sociabilis]
MGAGRRNVLGPRLVLVLALLEAATPRAIGRPQGPLDGLDPPPLPAVEVEAAEADAEPEAEAEEEGRIGGIPGVGTESVAALVRDANPMLIPLVLCSVATLGLAFERMIALRRGRVIPREFVERFLDRLSTGKLDRDRAAELCRAHESPIARIFGHAIRYWGQPATAIRQAVDADSRAEVADLKRNIRALNGTATLAPLLGLLGTVVGLIEAFDALGTPSDAGEARGQALAQGISLALVATAFGLAIAIVSVVAYYVLLGRVDGLVREMDEQVRRVIELVSAESWSGADRRASPGLTAAERARPESRPV